MYYCPHCHQQIAPNAAYCPFCGAVFTYAQPTAATSFTSDVPKEETTAVPAKGLGIASLIFGILSLCLPIVGAIFSLIGIILGLVARSKAHKADTVNRCASIGIILASIAILLGIGIACLFCLLAILPSMFGTLSFYTFDSAQSVYTSLIL